MSLNGIHECMGTQSNPKLIGQVQSVKPRQNNEYLIET